MWTIACMIGWGIILASAAVPRPASAGPILDHEPKRYSQGKEELVVRDYFKDARDGFFLDVGCAFPRRFSTTYYLEKHLGWSGIGVDAVEKYAPGWAKHRPRSKFFTYLVTDHSGTQDTFFQSGYSPISSIFRKAVEHHHYEEIEVESITLNDLLEREGVEKIDFLSLDIEGAGLLALRGFDINRYKPELICMEPVEDKMGMLAYFKENGYRWRRDFLKYDFGNWYFEPKDRPLVTEASLPRWTHTGDERIAFEMQGRELVAKVPPEARASAEALLCSPDGYDDFVLDFEVQASSGGMTTGTVVRAFEPHAPAHDVVGMEADGLTQGEWSHVRVGVAGSDVTATLDGKPVPMEARAFDRMISVCLRAGIGTTAEAGELRWRNLRVGPRTEAPGATARARSAG